MMIRGVWGWMLVSTLVVGGCAARFEAGPPIRTEGEALVATGTSSPEPTAHAARAAARSAAMSHILRRIGVRIDSEATYRTKGVSTESEARVTFHMDQRTQATTPELVFQGLRVTDTTVRSVADGHQARVVVRVPKAEVTRYRRQRSEIAQARSEARQAARNALEGGDWSGLMDALNRADALQARYRARFLDRSQESVTDFAVRLLDGVRLAVVAGQSHEAGQAPYPITVAATYAKTADDSTPLKGVPVRVTLPSGRTERGVTDGRGRAKLTLPAPRHPGHHTLRITVPVPWTGETTGDWSWAPATVPAPTAQASVHVTGEAGLAQGRFHPFVEVQGTGWAPMAGDHKRARRRARKAAVITAQAKLVKDGRLTQTTAVRKQTVTEKRTERHIQGQLPTNGQVVRTHFRENTGKVHANVVFRVPVETR